MSTTDDIHSKIYRAKPPDGKKLYRPANTDERRGRNDACNAIRAEGRALLKKLPDVEQKAFRALIEEIHAIILQKPKNERGQVKWDEVYLEYEAKIPTALKANPYMCKTLMSTLRSDLVSLPNKKDKKEELKEKRREKKRQSKLSQSDPSHPHQEKSKPGCPYQKNTETRKERTKEVNERRKKAREARNELTPEESESFDAFIRDIQLKVKNKDEAIPMKEPGRTLVDWDKVLIKFADEIPPSIAKDPKLCTLLMQTLKGALVSRPKYYQSRKEKTDAARRLAKMGKVQEMKARVSRKKTKGITTEETAVEGLLDLQDLQAGPI